MRIKTKNFGLVEVVEARYARSDRIAIVLLDCNTEELIARLTVNIPQKDLEPGEFFIKTWSENEQIAADCLASGLFVDTGKRVATGHAVAQVWRRKEDAKD